MVAVASEEGGTTDLRKSLLPTSAAVGLDSRKSVGTGTVAAAVSGARGTHHDGYIVVRHPHPDLADPTCGSYPPTPPPSPPLPHCQENVCAGNVGGFTVNTEGVNFTSTFDVPPVPETFDADAMTLYLYYNLVMDPGPAGTYNQFVPQLMLGGSFCNGTGPPEYFPTASTLNPLRTWYIQAQYFFKLTCQYEARGAFGEMVPVSAGDRVVTSFRKDAEHAWNLEIEAIDSNTGKSKGVSAVRAPHPFFNHSLSWQDAPFNGTAPGACWEVYGMENTTDYPRSMIYDINTVADKKQAFQDWHLTETPTCSWSPTQHAVATETKAENTEQRAEFVVHQ